MSDFVKIKGLSELGEKMRALAYDMNNTIARQATGAAAQVIKKQFKSNVQRNSVDTGSYLDAIIVKKILAGKTELTSEHIVTVRGRGKKKPAGHQKQPIAPYAHFVEFGTVKMAAEPNMRSAFEQEKGFAVQAMIGKLKAGIDKASK